jgi:hypothetical protein
MEELKSKPEDSRFKGINLIEADKGSLELKTIEFMPTILIGLGGTGKEVLLRIRRQFVEKYGNLNSFPIVSYLYIDTDNAPSEESGIARERDFLINDIDFQPSEKVFNPVNPADYIYRINELPHIKPWLNTTGEIANLGTMNTGAGQIRPAARLAFYHNFDEISSKLLSAKSLITDSRSINIVKDKHKIKNVNTEKINVYIISSISGGTGAGMFIDFGFLIRNLFRNQAITSCYIILPKIYQGYGKERIFANAYASLKELEYYNFKNKYPVIWKKNEPQIFQPGVFDDVYLIDGENYKNLSLSELSNKDIYKMLADSMFQDFSNSDFANYKRSVRVNLVQYKQRIWPDDDQVSENTFSRKYSTFGQTKISIPADRIILSCSYKLCEDIIDYYLSFAEGSQSDIDNYLLSEFLPELGILENKNKHQLLDDLYSIGEKSSVLTKIKEFVNSLQNDLTGGKYGDNWATYIISEKQKFDTNFRDDNDIARLGLYNSQIYSNKERIIKNLIGSRENNHLGNLERKIITLINDSSRGVFYSINLLRRIQFIFTNGNFDYIPKFEKDIKDLQSLILKLESEVKSRFQDLKLDESRSKINILKKSAMTGTLEKFLKSLDEYYNALVKLKSRHYAKDICHKILILIEKGVKNESGKITFTGLITDLNKLTGNLGNLKNNFRKKSEYFSLKQEDVFNIYIYEPEDINNDYYLKYIGTGQNASDKIKNLANKLLKELGASDVTDIVNILKDTDAKAVEESMVKFTKKQFDQIRDDYNITDILFEKEVTRSESKIRSMLMQAYPWLRINEIPGRFKLDDSAKKLYIGVKTNTPSFKKFQNLIYSIVGSNVEFKDSADNSAIIFYTEWAGFPLFYSYAVSEEMKNYYTQLMRNHNIDLHLNKNYYIYNDIIPLTSEEKIRLKESHRAFILGLIFNVIETINEFDDDTGKYKIIYKFTKQEGITVKRVEQLGIESRCINRLFEDQGRDSLRHQILKLSEDVQKKLLEKKYYAELLVLFEYYYENIYKIDEVEIAGGAKQKIETYEYLILRDLAKEIEHKVSEPEKKAMIEKVMLLKENMNSFSTLINEFDPRRTLNTTELLNQNQKKNIDVNDIAKDVNLDKLRNLKTAFDEGLITEEEYNNSKRKFLGAN